MASSIRRDISEKGFLEILEKAFFIVPAYQRNYSWDEYNLNALWDDIIAARTKRISSGNSGLGNHFMSSILVKDGDDDVKYIVDGQQRMITITLFLHAAKSLLEDDGDYLYESVFESLYGKKRQEDPATGRKVKINSPRITLKNQPEGNAYDALVNGEEWKTTHKASKIYKGYEFFRQRLSDIQLYQDPSLNHNLLSETIMTVLENLRIIYIPILSNESPQKIFESVNGLTKELFAGELIKNYLLMSTADELITDSIYEKYWAVFDESKWTGDDSQKDKFTKLLYHWIVSKGETLSANNEAVYRAFKSYAKLSSEHEPSVLKERVIKISKDINHSLLEYDRLESEQPNPTDRLGIFYTRIFSGKQALNAKSVLLLYINLVKVLEEKYDRKLTDKEVNILVEPSESYIIRRVFSAKGYGHSNTKVVVESIRAVFESLDTANTNVDEYCSTFAKELMKHILTYKRATNKWITNEEIIDYICGNTSKGIQPATIDPNFHPQARMLIGQFEEYKQSQNPFTAKALRFNGKDYTLEHWMPQNAKENDWNIKDKSMKSIYTFCFGNMAIIPQSINSKLSNHSLDRKLEIIQEHLDVINETSTGLKNLDWIFLNSKNHNENIWNEDLMYLRSRWIIEASFTTIFRPESVLIK